MKKTNPDERLMHECLAAIEIRLGWGDSNHWSKADFEELSEKIQAETGIMLSVTTLKRVWGKVKYENKPTVTTLNTLARFSGFESWRAFAYQENQKLAVDDSPAMLLADLQPTAPDIKQETTKTKYPSLVWILSLVIAGLVFVTLFSFYNFNHSQGEPSLMDASKFSFSLNKVITDGVPNSVIFNYDASAAPSDSVFIVQTWDITRKTPVSKNNHHHSAIYYYPGFFRTKLIVDNTVVKTQDLQITTNGWLVMADNEPAPIYFNKEDYTKDSIIAVDKTVLEKYNLPLLPHAPKIRFFNQGDFGNLMNDNFVFETTLKSESDQGDNACQYTEVLIQCKDDIIIIPLSAKTCVGRLNLYAAGADVNSKSADLSKFGCDLSEWTNLKVVCTNKRMNFFVNEIQAYSLTFPHEATGIVGVQYRFNGIGAVKNTKFWSKEGMIQL